MTKRMVAPMNTEFVEVDRPDDLYLIFLEEAMTKPGVTTEAWKLTSNGLYRSELKDRLEQIDDEPFPFDEPFEDYGEFMDTLRRFDAIGFIGRIKDRSRIALTDEGIEAAQSLRDVLSEEQTAAIEVVLDDE